MTVNFTILFFYNILLEDRKCDCRNAKYDADERAFQFWGGRKTFGEIYDMTFHLKREEVLAG